METRDKGGKFLRGVLSSPNPIRPGERRSKGTEFKPGSEPANKVPVGTITIRQHRNDGPRAWIKTGEPNEWMPRAVWVWISAAGPVPRGFIVHHLNENTLDDRIENLACMIRAAHPKEHAETFRAAQVGSKLPAKHVICSKCGGSFGGKYQREDSLCDNCKAIARRETKRRYKQRLRSAS